jgi:Icc-related predicted phosphoesterase
MRFGVARVAAIGDLHIRGALQQLHLASLAGLADHADVLIVTGDLTDNGRVLEAELAAELLATANIPTIAVLGNHDMRSLRRVAFRRVFQQAGIEVLEGGATTIQARNGIRVGIAGTMGCGGGFWPVEGPDAIHARTLKRLALRAERECALLDSALGRLDADVRIVATHFAPTTTTLGREPLAKYWMLGNCELGVVLDQWRPDLAIHGHAHLGALRGRTPGGVPVRNVALPVVGGVHLEHLEAKTHALSTSRYDFSLTPVAARRIAG